jgi:hypothetical protein
VENETDSSTRTDTQSRTSRRRQRFTSAEQTDSGAPSLISTESDANDRVRDWELPTNASRGTSRNILISLTFLSIIGLAGFLIWYMFQHMEPLAKSQLPQEKDAMGRSVIVPKVVDALPGDKPGNPAAADSSRSDVPVARIVSRLDAPPDETKWALSEFPTTGDRVEVDPTGIESYARNFTEGCIRPPEGAKVMIGVRGRESFLTVRSFVGDGEACATIFDEPFFEMKLANGEHRGVQFGLQQGAPYIAVKRIKTSSIPLQEIKR